MSIDARCANCQSLFRVTDDFAGKRVRCKKCGEVFPIPSSSQESASSAGSQPSPAPSTAPNPSPKHSFTAGQAPTQVWNAPKQTAPPTTLSRDQLAREVLVAFQGHIAPVRPSMAYRFSILLVTCMMVLLPLVYIALIGLVAFAIYYHAVTNVGMLAWGRGRAKAMVFLAYLAPMIVGGIGILFMLKPLFARPSQNRRTRTLTRDSEPLLFSFVDRVCDAVGAPVPKKICVDNLVNASASFQNHWLSMFVRSDLVLTLGLSLVAGLNMRQMAGVLAHEFGHFSQGAGMRLSYVIGSISYWFTRVVYERDEWDERLSQGTQDLDFRIGWILYLAMGFVWISRRVLWVLMLIGHGVSGVLMRQMEFDADRYEARMSGSHTFEQTTRRISELKAAENAALHVLLYLLENRKLADNLPHLILLHATKIPDEVRLDLESRLTNTKTHWLSTHPADKDRIANAHREQTEGVFRLEKPASELFQDFNASCRGVTLDFHSDILETTVDPKQLESTDTLWKLLQEQKK